MSRNISGNSDFRSSKHNRHSSHNSNSAHDSSDSDPKKIDTKQLTNIYKKNGSFDKQRRQLLQNFKQSETHANLLLKLKVMIENKINQDPSILMKNKGKMGALIQGEIINEHLASKSNSTSGSGSNSNFESTIPAGSGLLSIVDKDIQDKIIDSPDFHKLVRDELKDIRRILLGISDEDYQKELRKEADEEREKQERLKAEETANTVSSISSATEKDYKNNFRVKSLTNTHRIAKPPRFNFGGRNGRDSNENGDANEEDNKSVPFMMY
ncbi:hypothetical protein G9P44_001475 [Scheffersomyces stipitis]|nr:hypothetical protein G9P44_005176 [Scheffersomyces stipitis]KAG2735261.1 hypothetical protein G9P44_001475 [Scheffersomyces stipitis]